MTTEAVAVIKPEESMTLSKVGAGLFKSGLFPNAKNEYGAFAIVQYGAELGIGPMMALKNINIISGQLAANGQLMLSLAMARGVTYEVRQESDKGAKILFKRNGFPPYEASFTEEDAKAAQLLGKDNWKKYPRDMYFWRAVAKGVRRICPEAVMGLYTPDEITNGLVIDVKDISDANINGLGEAPANGNGNGTSGAKPLPTEAHQHLYDELKTYCNGDETAMARLLQDLTTFPEKDPKTKEVTGKKQWMHLDRIDKVSEKWAGKTLGELRKYVEAHPKEQSAVADDPEGCTGTIETCPGPFFTEEGEAMCSVDDKKCRHI